MRDYATISPCFWTGKTGIELRRSGPEALIVALYLMTCPQSSMIGIFHLSIATLAHDTGSPLEGASKGLRRGCELGFCDYDESEEVVFVKKMARFQVGDKISFNDKRRLGVYKLLQQYRNSRFYKDFMDIYGEDYNLKDASPFEGATPPPCKGLPHPLRSQEQEQEQEHEQEDKDIPLPLFKDAKPKIDKTEIEEIYNAYPRKVAKAEAIKAIEKVLRSGRTAADILERVKKYAASRIGEDTQYTPHPATWFNRGSYDDELTEKKNGKPGYNPITQHRTEAGEHLEPIRKLIEL